MRRSAVSIPSNEAEAHARTSSREFLHFLSIALGSLAELETQLELANRLGYGNSEIQSATAPADVIGKKLRCSQQAIRARVSNP